MIKNKRKRKYLGTAFQRKLLWLVLVSAIIPAAIVAMGMYYLIFHLLSLQLALPEAIAYNLMPVLRKVNTILAVAVPLSLFFIFFVALELSHRIAGPLYRMEKELDDRLSGKKTGPIILRRKDEFKALLDKINRLIS